MRASHYILAAVVAAATLGGLRAAAWHRWQHRAAWLGGRPGFGPGGCGAAGRHLGPFGGR